VGLGRIGRAVARRARGFDMRILYTKRSRLPEADERELGATYVSLEDLLRQADSCQSTPRSHHRRGISSARASSLL